MSVTDPNRNSGILNVNFPNSDQAPFKIATQVVLQNLSLGSPNNSPILLQPPLDAAFLGEPFLHTPNAFDIDGDSIAYELITPLSAPNYAEITEIGAGIENNLSLNEETGLIVWDAPQLAGFYTIAYKVKSYRDGEIIDYVIRDMTIEVVEDSGNVPEVDLENITGNEEIIFVELGDTVLLNIEVADADAAQDINISSSCGLYEESICGPLNFYNNHAFFTPVLNGNSGTATFEWIVRNEHIREQPYQVVVKGEDNTDFHYKNKMRVVRYKTLGMPTSTVEITSFKGFKISPNPVTGGFLNFNFEAENLAPESYKIYDNSGREVLKGETNLANPQINVHRLSNGMHYLSFEKKRANYVSTICDPKLIFLSLVGAKEPFCKFQDGSF